MKIILISLCLLLSSCTQYKKLTKSDDAPFPITVKTVSACMENNGSYPKQLPDSHIAFLQYIYTHGSYFDGAYHPLQVEGCGKGLYDIGDQYYVGWKPL